MCVSRGQTVHLTMLWNKNSSWCLWRGPKVTDLLLSAWDGLYYLIVFIIYEEAFITLSFFKWITEGLQGWELGPCLLGWWQQILSTEPSSYPRLNSSALWCLLHVDTTVFIAAFKFLEVTKCVILILALSRAVLKLTPRFVPPLSV